MPHYMNDFKIDDSQLLSIYPNLSRESFKSGMITGCGVLCLSKV